MAESNGDTSSRWRAARALKVLVPAPLRPRLREAAMRRGLVEPPPFTYPFRGLVTGAGPYYPNYRWGTLCAAAVAQTLGYERMSVIEFGVAGGNGLVALEDCARQAQELSGVVIDTYGFDSGTGLPKPTDYRDLPQLWGEGNFSMDADRLRRRLTTARLHLGPVGETVPEFVASSPAPIGFISFDLDLYSSTVDAFAVFEGALDLVMPRVVCYFDDIIAFSHSDFTGERLAISEFNERHAARKISKIYGLRYVLDLEQWWTDMMYMAHFFEHPRYNDWDGSNRVRELPLGGE
jgi:hypothetical protein